jgi:phosphoglycolate phosphatase
MQKIVLFDFDGVLADSFELSYQAAKDSGSPLTREQQRKVFEGNLYDKIKKLKIPISSQDRENYYSKYAPALLQTPPVRGIEESLRILKENYNLFLISSTHARYITEYVEMYNLDSYFSAIMGEEVHESKTAKVKMILDNQKAKAEHCVFITDTLGDIKEAAKCSVQSIGVTWGFHGTERLLKGKPSAIIDNVQDLVPAVYAFFKG